MALIPESRGRVQDITLPLRSAVDTWPTAAPAVPFSRPAAAPAVPFSRPAAAPAVPVSRPVAPSGPAPRGTHDVWQHPELVPNPLPTFDLPPAEDEAPARRSLATRALSALSLLVLLGVLGKLAVTGYYIFTDSFAAPLILSPDSDAVLPSKLNLARLQGERATLLARIEQADAALKAADAGMSKLAELREAVSAGLGFTQSVTTQTVRSTSRDLSTLSAQRRLIEERVAQQEQHVRELTRQLESGLVRKSDLAREQDLLNQLRVSALQNDREQLASGVHHHSSALAQRALNAGKGKAVSTPEMVQQKEQLIRIELELLKLDAEKTSKTAELRTSQEELAKLDGLVQQVKDRPVFRAIESSQNVAFVPYTQLEGASPGASVYECTIWGMLGCHKVGTVTEVLPGEVAAQDPWGAVARGQYALLQLGEQAAAKAKVLRIRAKDPLPDFELAGVLARFRL